MPGIFGVDEIERAIISRKVVPVRSIFGMKEKNPAASNEGTPELTPNVTRCTFSHFERLR